jgi:hypothetical protein
MANRSRRQRWWPRPTASAPLVRSRWGRRWSPITPPPSTAAYRRYSTQTVQHVFIDYDSDLLDVTLRSTPTRGPPAAHHSQHGQKQTSASHDETVHTTASHPWLSADRGWVRAGTLRLGERVLRAEGTTAIVVGLRVVPGAASMWDLTVSHLHTFAVGDGQYVVHNCPDGSDPPGGNSNDSSSGGSSRPKTNLAVRASQRICC